MADDDYDQTTVRIFRVDHRKLELRQIEREPGQRRKKSLAELIHEAVECLERREKER